MLFNIILISYTQYGLWGTLPNNHFASPLERVHFNVVFLDQKVQKSHMHKNPNGRRRERERERGDESANGPQSCGQDGELGDGRRGETEYFEWDFKDI